MALTNITPKMTSNTAPAPYVVTGSTTLLSANTQYAAFNGAGGTFHSASGTTSLWIQLDFGAATKVDGVSLGPQAVSGCEPRAPKDIEVFGSSDNVIFERLVVTVEKLWIYTEERLFRFPATMNYRYYKLVFSTNNGDASYITCGQIKFWKDDGGSSVANNKASMVYCLPKNTTQNLQQRTGDFREGLLGFANDDANYGTLWMLNKGGQFQIPKAAMANTDILFSGVVTQGTAVSLTKNYSDYKYLYMYIVLPNLQGQQDWELISKEAIDEKMLTYNWFINNNPSLLNTNSDVQKQISVQMTTGGGSAYLCNVYLYFSGNKSIFVPILTQTSATPVYLRVHGIK